MIIVPGMDLATGHLYCGLCGCAFPTPTSSPPVRVTVLFEPMATAGKLGYIYDEEQITPGYSRTAATIMDVEVRGVGLS